MILKLLDKLGRKTPIIPGVLIILISLFLFDKSDSNQMLLYVAILFGLGEGLLNASTNTLFADKAPKGYEGVTMGLLRTFGDLGFMIGPPILGFIIQKWNYRSALITDGVILLMFSTIVILFTTETKGLKKEPTIVVSYLFNHLFRVLFAAALLPAPLPVFGVIFNVSMVFFKVFLQE